MSSKRKVKRMNIQFINILLTGDVATLLMAESKVVILIALDEVGQSGLSLFCRYRSPNRRIVLKRFSWCSQNYYSKISCTTIIQVWRVDPKGQLHLIMDQGKFPLVNLVQKRATIVERVC